MENVNQPTIDYLLDCTQLSFGAPAAAHTPKNERAPAVSCESTATAANLGRSKHVTAQSGHATAHQKQKTQNGKTKNTKREPYETI